MERKRVNISVDPATYARLQKLRKAHGFKNVCELVVAFIHILLKCTDHKTIGRGDLNEDDHEYIASMFNELGSYERTPENTNPPKQKRKRFNMNK